LCTSANRGFESRPRLKNGSINRYPLEQFVALRGLRRDKRGQPNPDCGHPDPAQCPDGPDSRLPASGHLGTECFLQIVAFS
jgi:hypothetical protein